MTSRRLVLALASLLCVSKLANAQFLTPASIDSSGVQGNSYSSWGAVSSDGRYVVFQSDAWNLVPNDGNRRTDIFVHDFVTGSTVRVSVDSSGGEANNDSYHPAISADGTVIAFESYASNLVAGDTNGLIDAFVHDMVTGATELMNVDSSGVLGNGASRFPSVSADGSTVAFWSDSTNLVAGDNNKQRDIFVHDRVTGTTERVSVDSSGVQSNGLSDSPAVSGDGQVVVFRSDASNLVLNDANAASDVFVHDRTTDLTERASVDSAGIEGDDNSDNPVVSGDGHAVAFHSWATNLVSGDTNQWPDVFVHDRQTGVTELVSVDSSGAQANYGAESPSISNDAQIVAFDSVSSNLVSGDSNGQPDVFVRDRTAGTTQRVSVSQSGVEGNSWSEIPSVSADGQTVVFTTGASNLFPNDNNGQDDVLESFPCSVTASWSNYGSGFPGTLGIPAFTSRSNPVLGTSVTVDLANSSGLYSVALLFIGDQRTDIPSAWGGHLLVAPTLTQLLGLPPSGTSLTAAVPLQPYLCGAILDLQAFEPDPGAAKGVSFTQGLELTLGG